MSLSGFYCGPNKAPVALHACAELHDVLQMKSMATRSPAWREQSTMYNHPLSE